MSQDLTTSIIQWGTAGGVGAAASLLTFLFTRKRKSIEDSGYMKIKINSQVKHSTSKNKNFILTKTSVENTSRQDIIIQAAYLIVNEPGKPYWDYFDNVKREIKRGVDKAESQTRSDYHIRKVNKDYSDEIKKNSKLLQTKITKLKQQIKSKSKKDESDELKNLKEQLGVAKEDLKIAKIHHKKGIPRKNLDLTYTFGSNSNFKAVPNSELIFQNTKENFYVIFLPYYYHDSGNVTLGSYESLYSTQTIENFFQSDGCSITFCIRGRWRNERDYYQNRREELKYSIKHILSEIGTKLGGDVHRFHYGENRFVHDEVVFV